MAGTKYFNCDFHIHTPESTCYKDKSATPELIVQTAIDKGLHAIAITDHNTISGIAKVIAAAKDTPLVVFPGFELTAEGGHVIALFDPDTELIQLDQALTLCGILDDKRGKEEAIGKRLIDVMKIIVEDFHGIAIGAHADGPKGFLKTTGQGQLNIKIYNDKNMVAMELINLEDRIKYIEGKDSNYSKKMPIIQSSDAHRPEDIGRRSTLIKMNRLSIEGLFQAFNEHSLHITYPSLWKESLYPYIKSIRVDKGFLEGQVIEFNANLNCLLGGAGSGKSTIIEFLRFAFDQTTDIDVIENDREGKLNDLAGAGAKIQVKFVTHSGEEYLVSRVYDKFENPISIRTKKSIKSLDDVNIKKLFPVMAYSQGEALIISRDRRAQLELIDKHLSLEEHQNLILDSYRKLESHIDGLVTLEQKIGERGDILRDLATYDAKIQEQNNELEKIQEAQDSPVFKSHQFWLEERTYLSNLVNAIEKTEEQIDINFQQMEFPLLAIPFIENNTPNKDLISRCREYANGLTNHQKEALELLKTGLSDIGKKIKEEAKSWKKDYETHIQEYSEKVGDKSTPKIKTIHDELELYGKKRSDCQFILKSIDAAQKQYDNLLKTRRESIKTIEEQKDTIVAKRKIKVKQVMKSVNKIKIELIPNGNRDQYKKYLTDILTGTRARIPTIESICNNILPFKLAELIRTADSKGIENLAQIGDWSQKIIDHLKTRPADIYRLESVPVEDYLAISYEVEKNNYRPLEKLSTGQKATVIVSLSLIEGSTPIIFDQPEDALYSPFIFDDIVQLVRSSKEKRQFIFATHNANIAVGSDLDLGIVLDGSSSDTKVNVAGTLDDPDTKNLVILHLEGGERAIRARLKAYRIPNLN